MTDERPSRGARVPLAALHLLPIGFVAFACIRIAIPVINPTPEPHGYGLIIGPVILALFLALLLAGVVGWLAWAIRGTTTGLRIFDLASGLVAGGLVWTAIENVLRVGPADPLMVATVVVAGVYVAVVLVGFVALQRREPRSTPAPWPGPPEDAAGR